MFGVFLSNDHSLEVNRTFTWKYDAHYYSVHYYSFILLRSLKTDLYMYSTISFLLSKITAILVTCSVNVINSDGNNCDTFKL